MSMFAQAGQAAQITAELSDFTLHMDYVTAGLGLALIPRLGVSRAERHGAAHHRTIRCCGGVEVEVIDDVRQGWNPWDTWPPFSLDAQAAQGLGCEPAGNCGTTLPATVKKLVLLDSEQRRMLDADPYFAPELDRKAARRASMSKRASPAPIRG
ncbi:MAG: hypothetical protein M0Z82_17925 [Actinomycetota bacterium]|nr:hypothetical protein [Actinomycetota bacterium]